MAQWLPALAVSPDLDLSLISSTHVVEVKEQPLPLVL